MAEANSNICGCGHRRRDHRIEGPPGGPLSEIRWFECELCSCTQFDGEIPAPPRNEKGMMQGVYPYQGPGTVELHNDGGAADA